MDSAHIELNHMYKDMGLRRKLDEKMKGNKKLLIIKVTFAFVSFANRLVALLLPQVHASLHTVDVNPHIQVLARCS